MASDKSNAGVASVSPKLSVNPPNEIELFANKLFVISPLVNVSCLVFISVNARFDKSMISRDNSLEV